MFYILGTVWRYSETGFYTSKACPSCHQHVEMHEVYPTKYFSIFWIPLFPVGKKAPLFECPICHERFYSSPTDNKYRKVTSGANAPGHVTAEESGVIVCKSCGQKLRIPRSGSYRCPKCKEPGKVERSLRYKEIVSRVVRYVLSVGPRGINKEKISVGLVVFAFIVIMIWAWRDNRMNPQPVNFNIPQNAINTQPIDEKLQEKPLPKNGKVRISTGRMGDAPFKITTKPGGHHLVKLVNLDGTSETITIFIQDGETIKAVIPTGTYQMRIAAGNKWYGYEKYFGKEGSYSQAKENLTFEYQTDGVRGYEITLYGVIGGNLKTQETRLEDF